MIDSSLQTNPLFNLNSIAALLTAEEVGRLSDVEKSLAQLVAKGVDDYTFVITPHKAALPESTSYLEKILANIWIAKPNKLPDESAVDYFTSVFGARDSKYIRDYGSVYAGENRLVVDLVRLCPNFDAERIKDGVSVQTRILFQNRYPALVDLPKIERDVEVRSNLVRLCYSGFSNTKNFEGLKTIEPPFELRFEGFLQK